MDSTHNSDRTIDRPCVFCKAPVGMTCSEYAYLKQVRGAYDTIEESSTTPEELSAQDRMDRLGARA